MICVSCGHVRLPLYRGLCIGCAPDLHAKYGALEVAVRLAMEAYEARHGKTALGNWQEYEDWLERAPEGVAVASAMRALGHQGMAKA